MTTAFAVNPVSGRPADPTELADVVIVSPRRISIDDVVFHNPQTPVPTSFACG